MAPGLLSVQGIIVPDLLSVLCIDDHWGSTALIGFPWYSSGCLVCRSLFGSKVEFPAGFRSEIGFSAGFWSEIEFSAGFWSAGFWSAGFWSAGFWSARFQSAEFQS